MTRYGTWVTVVVVLLGGSGCYYDQWQDCMTSLRRSEEALAAAKTDLLDCEHMNKQKDTQIAALRSQVENLEQIKDSLDRENKGLQEALARAQAIMEKHMGTPMGGLTIVKSDLPPKVSDALDKLIEKYPNLIERVGNAVRWKADLLFPLGSDVLASSAEVQDALHEFGRIVNLPEAAELELVIVGHTCTTPIRKPETLKEHKTNWHLSAHRAIAVMRLLAEAQVAESRMGVMGYGELRPIADNATAEGKARNRRVEIYLVPKNTVQGMSAAPGVYESQAAGGAFVKPAETGERAAAR
ncbi:MAG: hypothetical protein AMXMBFR83_10880 [Phycisphaerae bacterium]